jgi:hypothetical protein
VIVSVTRVRTDEQKSKRARLHGSLGLLYEPSSAAAE